MIGKTCPRTVSLFRIFFEGFYEMVECGSTDFNRFQTVFKDIVRTFKISKNLKTAQSEPKFTGCY